MAPPRKTTLKDVAKFCDVSPMTVSKMVNGKGGVSKETSRRIWKAIRKLNYTPNMVAKSLRVNQTLTFGVVTSDSSALLFLKMISGIMDAADASGYSVIIANSNQNQEREAKVIDVLLNKRIDGLILAAPFRVDRERVEQISNFGIPLVLLMRSTELPVDFVASANVEGGFQLMDYLIQSAPRERRNFYFINLPHDHSNGEERRRGVAQAMRKHGLAPDPARVRFVRPGIQPGYEAMRAFLDDGVLQGTFVCGSDVVAVGAIQAVLDAGLRVPEDIRVSGYDDIEMLDYLNVPLTTMRQQVSEMGRQGVELLIRKIRDPDAPVVQKHLPCELVVRKST